MAESFIYIVIYMREIAFIPTNILCEVKRFHVKPFGVVNSFRINLRGPQCLGSLFSKPEEITNDPKVGLGERQL